jgi:hypothetical protein
MGINSYFSAQKSLQWDESPPPPVFRTLKSNSPFSAPRETPLARTAETEKKTSSCQLHASANLLMTLAVYDPCANVDVEALASGISVIITKKMGSLKCFMQACRARQWKTPPTLKPSQRPSSTGCVRGTGDRVPRNKPSRNCPSPVTRERGLSCSKTWLHIQTHP